MPGRRASGWRDVHDELTDLDDFRTWRMVYRAYCNCDDVLCRLQMRLQRYRRLVHLRDGWDCVSHDSDRVRGMSWKAYDATDVLQWQGDLIASVAALSEAPITEEHETVQ
jgi:hypothetical protein